MYDGYSMGHFPCPHRGNDFQGTQNPDVFLVWCIFAAFHMLSFFYLRRPSAVVASFHRLKIQRLPGLLSYRHAEVIAVWDPSFCQRPLLRQRLLLLFSLWMPI